MEWLQHGLNFCWKSSKLHFTVSEEYNSIIFLSWGPQAPDNHMTQYN